MIKIYVLDLVSQFVRTRKNNFYILKRSCKKRSSELIFLYVACGKVLKWRALPLSSWLGYIKCYTTQIDTESMHELPAVTLYNVPVTKHNAASS